jgi:hypothetical protein
VQYVAKLRALLSEKPDLIDAPTAEDEIRVALGGEPTRPHDPLKKVIAGYILLDAFASDLDMTDSEVGALLAEARQAAEQHLSGSLA